MSKPQVLHARHYGSGPVVVLLHGYLASSQYWSKTIEQLADKHHMVAIDLLGFGKSPKPACSKYDYDAQLASINLTLDHLKITKSFTLIGHSMGALLALRYAKENEDRVSKLILANMPILLSQKEARREIMGSNFAYQIGLRRGLHSFIWPLFVLTISLKLLPQRVAEGATERRRYMFQNTGLSRLRSMRNVIFAATIEADLLRLNVSTVLVHGINDRKQYFLNVPKLRRAKHIMSNTIEGGHHLPITHPSIFSTLLQS